MPDSQIIYKPTLSAMLPTAGLFLPETLHRGEGPVPGHTETDSTRLKYFQRKTDRSKHEAQEAEKSVVSISDLGSPEDLDAFPSIKIAYQFALFVSTSSKPSSESHALAILLHRVRQDVSEAHRLYLSAAVSNFLDAWPDRKTWIDSILEDIRRALNDIGQYIEAFRVAGDDGGATSLRRRFEWISGHQKRMSSKSQVLSTCHSSLVTAINIMQTVELCGVTAGSWQDPIYEAPVQPWVKNDDKNFLRGPYSRRESRLSQKNLSVSNIHLPESEQDSIETQSVNSIPAELPGSTPDDLLFGGHSHQLTLPLARSSHRRSSQRRTYFERHADEGVIPSTEGGSLSYSSSSPLDSIRICLPNDHLESRHSFDQVPPTISTAPDTSRSSLDSARPHSHPERSRGVTISGTIARTTIDCVAPLPTVNEKIIERNDSTTSTIVTEPQVARRYLPSHVYIRKQTGKHRSLPSELPHLQSQSLLTEDLADWMMAPSIQSEKLKSAEWDRASGLASPSMSIVSCPAVTQAQAIESSMGTSLLEDNHSEEIVIDSKPTSSLIRNEESSGSQGYASKTQYSSIISSPEPMPSGVLDRNCAASIRSYSSSITRKPIPMTAKLHSSTNTTTIATTRGPDSPNEENGTSVLGIAPRPLATSTTPSVNDAELSILQQQMLSQSYVDAGDTSTTTEVEEALATPSPSEPTPVEPEIPSPCSQDKEVVPERASSSTPVKPMSAQAKRRAAHQRRMELAFGRGL